MTTRPAGARQQPRRERGASLVLVLGLMMLMSFLAVSLLFTTDVEFRTGKSFSDGLSTLADTDNALAEVIYRLNLKSGLTPPPTGSRISVNSLTLYDAKLNPDPFGLLSNGVEDNANTVIDDPDELNWVRDWQARLVLTPIEAHPGSPWEEADTDALAGPPWGPKLVVPTIQPQASWRLYSVDDASSAEVLDIRFKLDTDTPWGDAEGDGPEIVFHDPTLARNGQDDKNTLNNLGGNMNAADDSPYNITYDDGTTIHYASGAPVLLVRGTTRVLRGGRVVARRRFEAEVYPPTRPVMTKALCGCTFLRMLGVVTTDSFKSSEGEYSAPGTPRYQNGDVGSNGNLEADGTIGGDSDSGGWTTGAGSVTQVATAGTTIAGTAGVDTRPNWLPVPAPCVCDAYPDVTAEVASHEFVNDNDLLDPGCQGPDLVLGGTCTLPGGDYYYNTINLNGGGGLLISATAANPVTIYVAGYVDIGGNGIVNTAEPGALKIVIGSALESRFRGTADFRGVVYAPLADLDLAGNADNQGAFLGNNVRQHGNAGLHFDEDLADLWNVSSPYKVLNWKEVD